MYKLLKSFKWSERETGKLLVYTGSEVSECGKKLSELGEDVLKELKRTGYISEQPDIVEPDVKPVILERKKKDKDIS